MLDRNALERFVDEYADKAYRAAFGLCGNEPEARELVQGAFVRIFDKAEMYDETQSLEIWFQAVLKNLYRDSLRRWDRRGRVSLDLPIGEDGLTLADALPDEREQSALERLEREECGARVRAAVQDLPDEQRAVLTMVDIEGMGYEDAARVLDWPLNTVRSRLFRARAALRDRLTEMEVAA